jgi:hypothetical protein
MDYRLSLQGNGFAKNKGNFANFDEGTGAMDWTEIGLQTGSPKPPKGPKTPDFYRLKLAPDRGSGSGGGGGRVNPILLLADNSVNNFVVNSTMLPNGYKVGIGLDRNMFRLNSGKSPVTITGAITGTFIKYQPTLAAAGYSSANDMGIVRISAPAALAGYEIPAKVLKLA